MKKHKDITLEDIEKGVREFFGSDEELKLTYDELRSKVLTGYWYTMDSDNSSEGSRKLKINMGSGGALLMIDEFEKNGIPAFWTAQSIVCYTDQGPYPLSKLKVKRKDEE